MKLLEGLLPLLLKKEITCDSKMNFNVDIPTDNGKNITIKVEVENLRIRIDKEGA